MPFVGKAGKRLVLDIAANPVTPPPSRHTVRYVYVGVCVCVCVCV